MFITNNGIIKEISIDHFRGLRNLKVDNLSRINVFVGANNCGKTSILEALKIMSDPSNVGYLTSIAFHRASATAEQKLKNIVNYVLSTFREHIDDKDRYYSIKMSVSTNANTYYYDADATLGEQINYAGERRQTLDIAVGTSTNGRKTTYTRERIVNNTNNVFEAKDNPLFRALYIQANASLYRSSVLFLSEYIVREGKSDILHILQSFDSNIEDISIIESDIYIHNAISGSMPLFTYGAGLQKAVLLTSVIVSCQNGIVLIDEIDNSIHVSAFKEVLSWFIDACVRYNVQAFITTHSIEALDAIINTSSKNTIENDILRVITLRKDVRNSVTRVKLRTGQEALEDRDIFKTELRV